MVAVGKGIVRHNSVCRVRFASTVRRPSQVVQRRQERIEHPSVIAGRADSAIQVMTIGAMN
jgi:hypothetical protein